MARFNAEVAGGGLGAAAAGGGDDVAGGVDVHQGGLCAEPVGHHRRFADGQCTSERGVGLDLLAHGGKVVFVGIHLGDLSFYNPNYHAREITLMSSRNATAQDFRRVMDNLASGKSSSDYWLAGMTAPEDVAAEFPKWLDVEAGIIKPVINWEA